jgi:hypothetical protein
MTRMSSRSGEADRYRRAATDALKVLDWCIWYFRYEGQGEIATKLERNRAHIRQRLESTSSDEGSPAAKPVRKVLEVIGLKPKPES